MTLATGLRFVSSALLTLLATISCCFGQTTAPTFSADLTLTVAADAGGGYDIYARTLAPFLKRHLPGNPNIIVQNMPGLGGVRMANHLFNDARKDGSAIGLTLSPVILSQLMNPEQVRYSSDKFTWIGTIEAQTNVLSLWRGRSPVKSIDDAKTTEINVGATTPDSFLYQEPALMNALIKTKFKIVRGYKGVNDIRLALERGEIEAQVSPWSSWKSDRPNWLKEQKLLHIVRTGAPADDLPGVPNLLDLVQDARARALVGLLDMSSILGRSIAAPPGVPAERVSQLRAALAAAATDSEFLDAMTKRQLPVRYTDGERLQTYVANALATPASVVREFQELTSPK